MNEDALEDFFGLVKTITGELRIQENPEKLFNMDKTGLPKNKFPEEIIAQGGRKPRKVVKITTVESGEKITTVGCCSAAGCSHIAPIVIS
jgi:hypothetical protein